MEGRDVGELPPVVNLPRRRRCRKSLRLFCQTYNPDAFHLKWGPNHLRAIDRIEESVSAGALFALAMPRGEGKTTICRHAVLWAASYGLVKYVVLIGATQDRAEQGLDAIKIWARYLPVYIEDFPEIGLPANAIGGMANRAGGQLCQGEYTRIQWTKQKLVLPMMPAPPNLKTKNGRSPSSGVIVTACGLTADGIRGSLHTRGDGAQVRPDFVLLDDPQTDESAASPTQNDTREGLIAGAVLGMAGPGERISAVMPCTIIRPDDMASRLLNRETHPLWRGERTRMLESLPSDMDAWNAYFEVYSRCRTKEPPDLREVNTYYRRHRRKLDAGATATWPQRKKPDEVSAIQSAMNLYCERGREAFMANYQNDPVELVLGVGDLKAKQVRNKLDGRDPGDVPTACEHLTAMIDVHDDLLYYVVCGFEPTFTGYVVDYAAYPRQGRTYYALRDASPTLRKVAPAEARSKQAAIVAGITTLAGELLDRSWVREDGTQLQLGKLLIDAGYLPKIVRLGIRTLRQPGRVLASLGRGISASNRPLAEWTYEPGDRKGPYWGLFRDKEKKGGRTAIFDANWWKSHVRDGFVAPLGDPGCISLAGAKPQAHRMLADHCAAEYPVPTEGQGRKLEEWKLSPAKPDNHFWDCLVGCAVGASVLGCRLPGASEPVRRRPRRRIKLLE